MTILEVLRELWPGHRPGLGASSEMDRAWRGPTSEAGGRPAELKTKLAAAPSSLAREPPSVHGASTAAIMEPEVRYSLFGGRHP